MTLVRPEAPGEDRVIRELTETAFAGADHASGTEGAIVDALRQGGALTLSLVAEQAGRIVGHIAFSPVRIEGRDLNWFGLGPVSVCPDHQRKGIGGSLIRAGLTELRKRAAAGCVVLGDPDYYGRFGFSARHALRYPGVPDVYFQSLLLAGPAPIGEVAYDRAFDVA